MVGVRIGECKKSDRSKSCSNKKDLADLGIESSVICREKRYSICRDEIAVDIDLFGEAAEEFKLKSSNETVQRILSLYKGEYLSDFEALWATGKRIKYREIYEDAAKYYLSSSGRLS